MSERYDVIVLGLGAMGSAAAYHLARRGRRVLGLERFTPAHTNGSSHGQSRIIRQAYYEDPAYVPLLLRAYELWDDLHRAASEPVLRITGGIIVGEGESELVAGSLRSAREHNLQHELLDAAEIRRRFPIFTPPPDAIALHERRGGMLYPEAAIRAHLWAAGRHGAELRFEEPVEQWQADPGGEGVTVTTARGSYRAEALVLAAGAWAPELLGDLGLPLTVKRNVLYWFQPAADAAAFDPDRCPIYIWEARSGPSFYGFPVFTSSPAGAKVAFHNHGPLCSPDSVDRRVHVEEIAAMREWLAQRIPALGAGELVATATCLYTLTPDMDFVLGAHPAHPQVTIASPCSGHGFKFAAVVGEILADLATERATRHPIDLFAPTRF